MSKTEIPEDIAALAQKIGRELKSEKDLAAFTRQLTKMTVEAALGAEMDEHLGHRTTIRAMIPTPRAQPLKRKSLLASLIHKAEPPADRLPPSLQTNLHTSTTAWEW